MIRGLRDRPEIQPSFIDASNEIEVLVEFLRLLGLTEDHDEAIKSTTADHGRLGQLGLVGTQYIEVPHTVVSTEVFNGVIDTGKKVKDITDVDHSLWTPGTEARTEPDTGVGSYTDQELNVIDPCQSDKIWEPHLRIAIHNPDSECDELFHHFNMPFDDDERYCEPGQMNQLEALAIDKHNFESQHPGFNLNPLSHRAIKALALMAKIKGEDLPLGNGYMHDGTLRRRSVGGLSLVGNVSSYGNQLKLGSSSGGATLPFIGVGVSAGHNEDLNS